LAFYVEFDIIKIAKKTRIEVAKMENVLNDAVNIIVKNFAPDKIILFGSRVAGTADQDSDYDLCIWKNCRTGEGSL
jgi:predicted nucleotidyltransferase